MAGQGTATCLTTHAMHNGRLRVRLAGILWVTFAFMVLGAALVGAYWLAAELLPGTVDGYTLTWLPPVPWLLLFGAAVGGLFGLPVAVAAALAVWIQESLQARRRAGGTHRQDGGADGDA